MLSRAPHDFSSHLLAAPCNQLGHASEHHDADRYGAALATSALSVAFEAVYPAYLASLVRPEELVAANSIFEASGAG